MELHFGDIVSQRSHLVYWMALVGFNELFLLEPPDILVTCILLQTFAGEGRVFTQRELMWYRAKFVSYQTFYNHTKLCNLIIKIIHKVLRHYPLLISYLLNTFLIDKWLNFTWSTMSDISITVPNPSFILTTQVIRNTSLKKNIIYLRSFGKTRWVKIEWMVRGRRCSDVTEARLQT